MTLSVTISSLPCGIEFMAMKSSVLNKPVVLLTGNEFLPVEGLTFAQQVLNFFVSQGGVAHSPFGPVLLDM